MDKPMNLEEVLQALYDSEINAVISWLWDGGIDVGLGDEMLIGDYRTSAPVKSLITPAKRGIQLRQMLDNRGLDADVMMVTRIDRLARSTFDLFAIVKQIVNAKAQFRSLAEPSADTGTNTGRLMIAVLGGLADVERDLIRTRTAEGRSRAQKRGQHIGRPRKLTAAQQTEARRRAQGATLAELAGCYGVGKSTISRL